MAVTPLKLAASAAVLCAVAAVVPAAHASPLEAKRAEARRIEAQLRSSGERLSMADEEYNQARLRRQSLDAQAASARSLEGAAKQRWLELRTQLSKRVRNLYMHPGAVADALLGVRTLGELSRARAYGSSVLTADTQLVMQTEKARQELMAKARTVEGLRRSAERNEDQMAAQRSSINRELGSLRSVRSRVSGDIARLLEAERRAALRAASRAARPGPTTSGGGSPGRPVLREPQVTNAPPPVRGSAGTAVAVARQQIGKPYEWAAAGPDTFDCSGLTMYAWGKAGVSLPHSSRAQYASLPHVSRANLQPGDLVFYGSPIHHMGIYEGGGVMINAPQTGEFVRRDSINRSDFAGAARP
jgi:cell wall-associated NlpC family hydrolase